MADREHADRVWPPCARWSYPNRRSSSSLPDGQVVRCEVVNLLEDGAARVVPEHEVVIG